MVGVASSIWEGFWGYVFYVIGFITRHCFRLLKDDNKDYTCDRIDFYEGNKREEEEEEIEKEKEESKDFDKLDSCSSISSTTKNYEVFTLTDINGYIEERKAMSFTFQELYLGSKELTILDSQVLETTKVSSEKEDYRAEDFEEQEHQSSESEYSSAIGEVLEAQEEEYWKNKLEFLSENDIKEEEEDLVSESKKVELEEQNEELSEMTSQLSESCFLDKHGNLLQEENNSLPCDEPYFEEDHDVLDSSITYEFEGSECEKNIDQTKSTTGSTTQLVMQHNDNDSEEFIELEPNRPSSIKFGREEGEEVEDNNNKKKEEKIGIDWEHEDVIEQLKWELRNARRTGLLPTILEEESEEGWAEEDHVSLLRPVKIEFQFGYKERLEEVQKVYNIYAERMRKLDILNNQTMHALGLLQLKDQFKSSPPKQKPIVKNFLAIKSPKIQSDPSELNYAAKLQNDFELVYVGQVCLSWEILHWQHRRVRDLLPNDNNQSYRRFNLVASEFQLFQVLIQRFIEDESFRGPRVQNYVKNRCVIRSLMQVPVVKDDHAKDQQYVMEGNEDSVFVESLDRIIVEAMLTFREFVRKDEKNINLKVPWQRVTESGDSKLFLDVRKEFQKKERKLKDIQRIGNCVVRKLQKNQQQGRTFQHALLVAQVELRLVSRVLSMSRISRDQLVWCQQKLNQISFANKNVHLENSFLLFSC